MLCIISPFESISANLVLLYNVCHVYNQMVSFLVLSTMLVLYMVVRVQHPQGIDNYSLIYLM